MKKPFILIFIIGFRSHHLINAEFIKPLEEHTIVDTYLALPKA